MEIMQMAQEQKDYAISLRREFHMYPEPSFKEFETVKRVKRELDKMGIEYRKVTETGVVAEIKGGKPGKTVALRADMDALEVTETTGLPFASRNVGVMHACGHDVHIVSLLAAADILNQNKADIAGRVLLIFQPAEERVSGAKAMMEADSFMDEVDAVFGLHVNPEYPAGSVCCCDGGMMFAGEAFKITIRGKSGHGSTPHLSVNALLAASAIVLNSQSIISHEIDSRDAAVITICKFQSGTRFNVIPAEAELSGTYRCYTSEIREHIKEALTRMAETTARSYRAIAKVEFDMYVPPVFNDKALGKIVRDSAALITGKDNIIEMKGQTSSDDFSYYMEKVPGYYIMIGSGHSNPKKRFSLHDSNFYIDENCIPVASSMYVQCAVNFLKN